MKTPRLVLALFFVLSVSALLDGCSLKKSPKGGTTWDLVEVGDGAGQGDGEVPADVPVMDLVDTNKPDSGEPDSFEPDSFDLDSDGRDDHTDPPKDIEQDIPPNCQPGSGQSWCPCTTGADCLSGFCVLHLGELICSAGCVDECPAGFKCEETGSSSGDMMVCVSKHPSICLPCVGDEGCQGDGAVCTPYGYAEGAFCGYHCQSAADCPSGYDCFTMNPGGGQAISVCMLAEGECACTDFATENALSGSCMELNEYGMCQGERVCGPGGLSACSAATPAPELCDGLDNDCDSLVDEGELCPAPNPCVTTWCDASEGCKSSQLEDGQLCDDGDPCTTGDVCQDGECVFTGVAPGCEECGDGFCSGNEDCSSCPSDCGACCGNGVCQPEVGETCASCVQDCGCILCGEECLGGLCLFTACEGLQCGSDGCGGSCGICGPGKSCDAGTCVGSGISSGYVKLPAGSFWMGSPDGVTCPLGYAAGGCDGTGAGTGVAEKGRYSDEKLHYVVLTHAFEIKTHELTQGDWATFWSSWNPSKFPACGATCPVEYMTWYDALAFTNKMSADYGLEECYLLSDVVCFDGTSVGSAYLDCFTDTRGGISAAVVAVNATGGNPYLCEGYRLPTEAEWEYAARAGSYSPLYPSPGNDGSITQTDRTPLDPNLDMIGWYGGNSSVSYGSATDCTGWFTGSSTCGTLPVGGKAPNVWGLFDMAGNVWEWTWDWYVEAYPDTTMAAPDSDPVGPGTATGKVIRGGSWFNTARNLRSGNRNKSGTPASRINSLGMRPVRTILD